MKTLIYSHLWKLPGSTVCQAAALRTLLNLWFTHLRGPGRYDGDILLFTNVPDLQRPGLMVRRLPDVPDNSAHVFVRRVLTYHEVPVQDYDVVMQMDLDLLAVDAVVPMFPRDERLWAAPSDMRMLDWRHAWTLIPRWRRAVHKLSGWRMHEMGASACVVASASTTWERNLGAWARAIREHGDRRMPRQSDQSFLNLLLLERTIPMARWSAESIRHRNWNEARQARLLHFPGRRKEHMQRYRKV
jgi:hypothetical protein